MALSDIASQLTQEIELAVRLGELGHAEELRHRLSMLQNHILKKGKIEPAIGELYGSAGMIAKRSDIFGQPGPPIFVPPTPDKLLPRVGRRFKRELVSDKLTELGRPVQLPTVTIHADVARRMRERIGLARFVNQQVGDYSGYSERFRWRVYDPEE